jgi:hypothetical protein
MLASLERSGWRLARAGTWLTAALCLILIVNAVRTYPDFMPVLNSLSLGRPGYELVNDSNLDWGQALPQVERWVRQRGLQHVLVDEYGFFDSTVYVPQSEFWNCQKPSPSDGGNWAVVSAGSILDAHNCGWLLQYPHEMLAAGSMYAFQLPAAIPAAGSPDGPPLPADWHNIGGGPPGFDFIQIFRACVRDPGQLQPTWDRMTAYFKEQAAAQRRAGKK